MRGERTGPLNKTAAAHPDFTRKPRAALSDLDFTSGENGRLARD